MLCLIRPQDDSVSQRLSGWWDRVERDLPNPITIRRVGRGATRRAVENGMKGSKAIFYFGHGKPASLVGRSELVNSANIHLANGAVIVAIACYSGAVLAKEAIRKGTVGYIGFLQRWASPLAYDPEFGDAVKAGLLAILRGETVGAATEAMRSNFNNLAVRFKRDKEGAGREWLVGLIAAQWLVKHVNAEGDLDAMVSW